MSLAERAAEIVAGLTDEERLRLTSGHDFYGRSIQHHIRANRLNATDGHFRDIVAICSGLGSDRDSASVLPTTRSGVFR